MSKTGIYLYVDDQYASPYAMSAYVALREKELPFELVTLNLGRSENRFPEFANKSLTQRVPTLIHGDFSLSESSAIAEYIDETFEGTHLYPVNSRDRARVRQVQAWLRSDLLPIRQERSTEVVFYGSKGAGLSPLAQSFADKLFVAATAMLPPDKEYLCDGWSIADVDLALMLNRLVMHGDCVPERLARYARHQWERPTVQEWVNKRRPPH